MSVWLKRYKIQYKIKYLYLKIYNNTIAYINRQKAVDKIYINFNIYQVGLT